MEIRKTVQNLCVFLMIVALLITSAGSLNYGFTSGERLYMFTGTFSIGVVIVLAIRYVLKQFNGKDE